VHSTTQRAAPLGSAARDGLVGLRPFQEQRFGAQK